MQKRGQVSLEYLMLVAFVLVVLVPLVIYAYDTMEANKDSVHIVQAEQAGNTIVREAEAIYYLGPPSLSRFDVYFPDGLHEVIIASREITFRVHTQYGIDDIVLPSRVNLTGTLTPSIGMHRITVTAGPEVLISE